MKINVVQVAPMAANVFDFEEDFPYRVLVSGPDEKIILKDPKVKRVMAVDFEVADTNGRTWEDKVLAVVLRFPEAARTKNGLAYLFLRNEMKLLGDKGEIIRCFHGAVMFIADWTAENGPFEFPETDNPGLLPWLNRAVPRPKATLRRIERTLLVREVMDA